MRTIDLGALLLPLLLATGGSDLVPQEPGPGKIAGKSIRDLESSDDGVRRAAIDGLKALLKDPDGTRVVVQALTEALSDSSAPIRWTSASILEEIGPAAAPASGELIRLLGEQGSENYGPRLHAEKALVAIGRGAVPALVAALRGEDPEVQARVCRILSEIGPEAGSAAVPALLKALKDPDLRWHAALALAGMKLEPASSVPVLVEIVRADSPDRGGALAGLAGYGAAAKEALPAIIAAFESAAGDLRRRAAVAMVRVDPRSPEADQAVAWLLKELDDPGDRGRKAAILALGEIGLDRSEVLPALLGVLRQNERRLWLAAIEALGRIGPEAKPAIAEIRSVSEELAAEEKKLPEELAGLCRMARNEIAQALRRIEASGEDGAPPQVEAPPAAEADGRLEAAGGDPAAEASETEIQGFLRSAERLGFRKLGSNPQGFSEFSHLQTGMVFVLVPGGEIVVDLGTSVRREQTGNRRPQREFTVPPFLIGKYEVTQAQWQAVMGKNPSWFQGPRAPEGVPAGELPVENVRFDSVRQFCGRTGLFPPTVPEWGLACRGTTAGTAAKVDRRELGWFAENSGGSIHPVGKKDPNGFGLHDLYGNVWEYCGPIWHLNGFEYYGRPGPEKLRGSTGWCPELQGGSFRDPSSYTGSPLHPAKPFLMTEEPPWHAGFRAAFPLRESERTRP